MAHYAKPLSFLFLILLSTSLQIEARERVFFSKVTHTSSKSPTTKYFIESESPQLAPSPAPAAAPTTTTTTTAEELSENSEVEEEEETGYPYNKNAYSNNQNNYNANGYTNNYNSENNAYLREKQGMSDTRFVENGKYYYDVKNENYYGGNNGYESERGSGNYYNGNGENEFDSMEEYERQQGYPQSQGEYVP